MVQPIKPAHGIHHVPKPGQPAPAAPKAAEPALEIKATPLKAQPVAHAADVDWAAAPKPLAKRQLETLRYLRAKLPADKVRRLAGYASFVTAPMKAKGGDISVRTLTHDKKFALVRFQEDSRHTHWGFVKVGALDPSSLAQARARVKHTIQGFTRH